MRIRMDANDAWEANTLAKTVLTKLGVTDLMKDVSELSGVEKARRDCEKRHPAG